MGKKNRPSVSRSDVLRAQREIAAYEPVRLSSTDEAPKEERIPLFYMDDREYTVPKVIRPNLALKYLQNVKDEGAEYAVAKAMEDIIGADAMDELASCDSITDEQMEQVMGLVESLMIGAADKLLGKS